MFRLGTSGYTPVTSSLALAPGAAEQEFTITRHDAPSDGATSLLTQTTFSANGQFVRGLRVGYMPPPRAFVPKTPVPRVLDTRNGGGKLGPNQERIVNLGVPGFAKAAVMNLTITETEHAGFVAVFPAHTSWPGNSSINWSTDGQNTANTVVTAVDSAGRVKIRGGVNRTHVVIDVQGYLL